jgi:hypothetical protein
VLVRSGVTILASPRGLGKTHAAVALAAAAAAGGHFRGEQLKPRRVLYLDRDNPPSELRRRMKRWGADKKGEALKVLDRRNCPPLTDTAAWSSFPYSDYDCVIIDSWSAVTEGIKEKEAGENGKAMAALLDNARKGPSMLLLANCRKDEGVLRGSGVIGDRADIVYEIRDATDLKLDARHEQWIDALPPADETQWASRAKRRKRREVYRLAFIASKFRVGEEPDPFVLEIRLLGDGEWSIIDVTQHVDDELSQLKGEAVDVMQKTESEAIARLKATIAERYAASNPVSGTEAVDILHNAGLARDHARHVRDDLAVGVAAQWRKEPGKHGGSILLPLLSATSATSQGHTQTGTSDESDVADTGTQEPHSHGSIKANGDRDLVDGASLRTRQAIMSARSDEEEF